MMLMIVRVWRLKLAAGPRKERVPLLQDHDDAFECDAAYECDDDYGCDDEYERDDDERGDDDYDAYE